MIGGVVEPAGNGGGTGNDGGGATPGSVAVQRSQVSKPNSAP